MVRPQELVRRPGALLAVAFGVLGGAVTLGLVVYLLIDRKDVSSCYQGFALSPPLDWIFLIACAGSFLLGGLFTRVPGLTRPPSPGDSLGQRRTRARTFPQLLLVLVLLILTLLLAYETWSLSPLNKNPNEVWPITYFVRCSSRVATTASLPVISGMCAFFGKWMWYRPGAQTP
jgi:hypothetical protein